jgi:hypothetical protein
MSLAVLVLAGQALCPLSHSASHFFSLATFAIGSHFMSRPAWITILLFVLSHVTGKTGMHHHSHPLVEMEGSKVFAWVDLEPRSSQSLLPK